MSTKKTTSQNKREVGTEALHAYGPNSANLKLLGQLLNLKIGQRGRELILGEGAQEKTEIARKVIAALTTMAANGQSPTQWDTECLVNLADRKSVV